MKRIVAILIAAILLVTACGGASAENKGSFSPTITNYFQSAIDVQTSTYLDVMMATSDTKAVLMSMILLDYLISGKQIYGTEELSAFNFTTPSYIYRFGTTTIDMYFRLESGLYLNLFYAAGSKEVTIYGTSYFNNSDGKYEAVSGITILSELGELAATLAS